MADKIKKKDSKQDIKRNSKITSKRGSKNEEEELVQEPLLHQNVKDMHAADYLEESLVPLLEQGCQMIAEKRPEDPLESLAQLLLDNDPKSPRNIQRFAEEAAAKLLAAEEEALRTSIRKKSSVKSAKKK